MATRADAVQAARETGRLGVSTVVEGLATGIIEIGAATPVVAPLCVALLKAKEVVDGASRNREELAELGEQCHLISVQVIDKAKAAGTSTIDVDPLRGCVDKLAEVAKRYHDQGFLARVAQSRRYGNDIQRLRARLNAAVQTMGLSGVVTNGEKLDQILARLQPRTKVAPVPKNAPVTKSSHIVRDGVVERACNILGGDGGPAVAALTGRSGAGKTTSAAAMVGERGVRVRELFPHGVVWLPVGKGEGAADRLPSLMLTLAKRLHEDVMKKTVDAPGMGEDGGSYVRKIVSQELLRCLVVADNVWEASVVQKLRETGMWVLLTTRFREMVEPSERVVMDTLTETEAENVLRSAATLPPGERLCDAANHVLMMCGHVAMDTAFVGSWICHFERKEDAWSRAVKSIKAQEGGVGFEQDVNRLAILRAGFEYLGTENVFAQKLYAELAVFPDGHAFGESDAAVLLGDEEGALKPLSILERWGVVKADASEKYRMHDAHVDFARSKLMGWEHVRGPAVESVAVTLHELGVCVREAGRLGEAEALFRRALEIDEAKLSADDGGVAATLHKLVGVCERRVGWGRRKRCFGEIEEAKLRADDGSVAVPLHSLGVCVREAGRLGEAEVLFRRALEIEEAKLGADDGGAGRLGEAEALFRRALEIKETDLWADDRSVAVTLHELGACVCGRRVGWGRR
eukprot:g6751.t1